MATTTMTTVSNILKEVYEDGINDQLQSEVTAFKRVERTSEGVSEDAGGKYVRFGIRTGRNHGIGARNENEALPVAQVQTYASAQVNLKYLYGSLQLTGQVFKLADKNFQAFASALDAEISGLQEGLRKDLARQAYGTGRGTIVTGTGAGSTTTLVTTATTQAPYAEVGMVVDLYDNTNTIKAGGTGLTITAVTPTLITFTPAATGATASGDYLVRTASNNKEITGLGSIIASAGALYGVDPATVPVWASYVGANGGTPRALTEALMITTVDEVRKRGGGVPTVGFYPLGVRRAYFALLQSQRRIVGTSDFQGGFSGLTFTVGATEIPMVEDVDAPPQTILFVNEKQLKIYRVADWQFMDEDGSKWQRVVTAAGNFDAYSATMYCYMELGTHRRNSHAKLADITEA